MHHPYVDLSLIVAMTEDRVIGRNNDLPWRIPSDMSRFRKITTGHPIIMGRKNWESIDERVRPLKNRCNIVLTRKRNYRAEGALIAHSIQEAYLLARNAPGADEIFIIGGEEIYQQFIQYVQKAYITLVQASISGETHFPKWNAADWVQERVPEPFSKKDDADDYPTQFTTWQRA